MINDGLVNLVTAAGSTIDPIANNQLFPNDFVDRCTWYHNGGIASSIVDYWPQLVGSGIKLTYDKNIDGNKKTELDKLINYLDTRYQDLQLLRVLTQLHTEVHLHPVRVATIDASGSSYTQSISSGQEIMGLTLLHVEAKIEPLERGKRTVKYSVAGEIIDSSRLLVMTGRSSGGQETPLIDSNTILAEQLYSQCVGAAATLLQKKNLLTMGIDGFNKGLRDEVAGEYSNLLIRNVKHLQKTSNILNVVLHDRKETELGVLERALTNVDNIIDRARDYLLSNCNNIPETRLFGASRIGGLSRSNDDDDRTNSEADRIFSSKWEPLIKQLNKLLIKERGSPSARSINDLIVARVSSYKPRDIDVARTRLINAQAAKLEAELEDRDV